MRQIDGKYSFVVLNVLITSDEEKKFCPREL
jgi:hypothetical protein